MRVLLGIILLVSVKFLFGCSNSKELYLRKIELDKTKLEKGIIEIDTVENLPEKGMCFINIITNRALGNFSMQYAIVKSIKSNSLIYAIDNKPDQLISVSKEYLAIINSTENAGWGWFYIKNKRIVDKLPKVNHFIDSLKSDIANLNYYISESHGEFFFNINGTTIKTLNYGNLITGNNILDFKSLEYKLYELNEDSLIVVSKNGNDLLKQKDGIYFIPPPGYSLNQVFNKWTIIDAVDSVSKLEYPPTSLKFHNIPEM